MTRRVLFEGSQGIIIRYKIYNARVYPSEVELSDCIRLGVFLFLGLRSFSLRRNKEKECKCRVRGCISPDYKNIFVIFINLLKFIMDSSESLQKNSSFSANSNTISKIKTLFSG